MSSWILLARRFPFLAALIATAACGVIRYALWPGLGDTAQYSLFYFSVAFAASIGGWGPGVFAQFFGATVALYFFVIVPGRLNVYSAHQFTNLGIFIVVSALIIAVAENARRLRARTEADARLVREAERYFRSIFDNAAVAIATIDKAGRFMNVNKVLCKTLGREYKELLGKRFADFTLPEDIAADEERFAKLMAGELRDYVIEKRYIRGDGETVWVLAYRAAVTDEKGMPAFSISVAIDITDRKAAEAKLKRFWDSGMLGAIYFTLDGKITDANDKFLDMVQYSRVELAEGKLRWDSLTPLRYKAADDFACSELIQKGVCTPYEKSYVLKDGREIPIVVSAAMIDEARFSGVALIYDMSRRKELEDNLKKARRELEETVADLEGIISFISHDLRSPLVTIRGFSKELEKDTRRLKELTASVKSEEPVRAKCDRILEKDLPESLGFIDASTNFMDSVITSLVKVARIGMAAVRTEPVDMNTVTDEVIKSLAVKINEAGVRIERKPLCWCIADRVQISQAITNLIDNAIKYREPSRQAVISISCRPEGDRAVYTIADNGIGIDTTEHQNIFKMFYRVGTKEVSGEGIGLSMVKRMLERSGGRIWVESEPGSGTKFHIALPKV